MRFPHAPFALVLAAFVGCAAPQQDGAPDSPAATPADAAPAVTATPEDDFYLFVNGSWIASHPVPPEYSSYGVFHEIHERGEAVLHEICEDAAARRDDPQVDHETRLVGRFWAAGMDQEAIDARGAEPLRPWLDEIDSIRDREDLVRVFAELQLLGVPAAMGVDVDAGIEFPDTYLLFVTQGGLGLPERDYYFSEAEDMVRIRDEYREHLRRMLELGGLSPEDAADDAFLVMELETAMAESALGAVEMRDPQNLANEVDLAGARAIMPHFDWELWFRTLGMPVPSRFDLAPQPWFEGLDRLLTRRSLDEWKAYLRFHLISATAPYLASPLEEEDFRFYQGVLRGQEVMKPRWKRVLAAANGHLGQPLGKVYVARAFSPRAKAMAEEMVAHLLDAFRENLMEVSWMGDETRAQALRKLDAFGVKIGYPDEWEDYSGLELPEGDWFGAVVAATRFDRERDLAKVDQPVDENDWGMNPQTVNAYYHPLRNEIVFPAAIMQPPFFGEDQDPAENYGAMGAIIGHEITHGFDDQGSQFDAEGRLRNWWTPEDRAEFERRAQVLVEQANAFEVLPGLFINGELTLGENLADLGGVEMAWRAFREHALAEAAGAERDGMTPEQRFFHAYAVAWRNNARPEFLRWLVQTNPHAPSHFRCNGPLSNLPDYAKAWDVPVGAPMARPESERVQVW